MVAMDARGHGLPGKPRGEEAYADPERWAADAEAVIDELGLENPYSSAGLPPAGGRTEYLMVHGDDAVAGVTMVAPRIALREEDPTEKIGSSVPLLLARVAPSGSSPRRDDEGTGDDEGVPEHGEHWPGGRRHDWRPG